MDIDSCKYMKVSIKDLLLDDKNYRFPFSMVDRSQNAIIKYLLNNEDAKKIVDSINAYGYLPNNALYIVKSTEGNDKYIVKEGNRRCASVKALLDPVKYGLKYPKTKIKEVDCYLFDNPKLLDDLILSRHTQSEIKSWHRLQQARYVKDMVDNGTPIEEVKINQSNILYKLALFCETLMDNNKNIVNFIEMNNVSTVFERLFAKELEVYVPFSFKGNELKIKDEMAFDIFVKAFYKLVEDKKADTRTLSNSEMTKKFLLTHKLINDTQSETSEKLSENQKPKEDNPNKQETKNDNSTKGGDSKKTSSPKEQTKLFQNINFSPLMVKYPSFCELAKELQKLNFKKQPYSAFVLLRMFVEGAIKIYLSGVCELVKNHSNKTLILTTYTNLLTDIEINDNDGLEIVIGKMRKILSYKTGSDYFINTSSTIRDYFNNQEIDNFRKETNKIVHKNCYPAVPDMVKRYGNPFEDKIAFLLFTEDFKINEIYIK